MNHGFWRGRRVLVTGHTGFKGSWLSVWLNALGARVTGLALDPPTDPSMYDAVGLASEIDDRRVDIRNLEAIDRVLEDCKPEVVFHLAAQAIVRDGYREPVGTFATNVLGTVNVLDAIRRCDAVRAAVVVTSDKCYENDESGRAFREGDRLGGYDPYSASKACAELVTSSYWCSYLRDGRAAVATVRAGNVIGGGDWARDRLLPDLVRGFASGSPAGVRNPAATRPWQHVLEPLKGCLMLAEGLARGEHAFARAWNFGPAADDVRAVSYVATRATSAWGSGVSWTLDETERPHEARLLSLDSSQARTTLGWRPRWSVDRAIDESIAWYKAHACGDDMRVRTQAQILAYSEGSDEAS